MPPQTVLKLPNAPLVEAVFELRWALQPSLAYADPGFPVLLDNFSHLAGQAGFSTPRDLVPPDALLSPHSIFRRFYLAPDRDFPLLQIGPGVLATNQSSEYDWPGFKKQVLDTVRLVLKAYPHISKYPLSPIQLELRYLDAFDASLVGTADLIEFLKIGTSMKIELPPIFSKLGSPQIKGRVVLETVAKAWKSSKLILDIASGQRNATDDVVRLETKVVTQGPGVPKLKSLLKDLNSWLNFAHGLTSPFFKEFVTSKVMQKFKEGK
jgi:hypothetical protein